MARSHASARLLTFAIIALLAATIAMPVVAEDDVEVIPDGASTAADGPATAEAVTGAWFIELASPPAVKGTDRAQLAKERDDARAALARAGLRYSERQVFESLWNGFSLDMSASDAAAAAKVTGIRAVYPVVTVAVPRTAAVSDPELFTALAQTGADVAQASGFTGTGIKVAVMDTGIDYHHPDLGGCFGTGCKVFTGRDFVGDGYNAGGTTAQQTVPRPDNDPDDCNGHGTHVAGIIGANGDPSTNGARGVAPDVTFGAYRVFGCDGSTSVDIMIAAMERALADGMQVLNMSIGSSFQWPSYPTAVASDNAVDAGMVVVASIGNSGASGVYSSGAPGVGDKVVGVASFDNTHLRLRTFTVSPDGLVVGYQNGSGSPVAPMSGSLPLSRTNTSPTADGCTVSGPLPAGLAGTAVLIKRGTCSFHEKVVNAQNAGAAAVVIYNSVAGRVVPAVGGPTPITIPVVSITLADGNTLSARIAAGATTLTWTATEASFANPTGNRISGFSSYGLAPDLSLKPDIGAPGGFIRSTLPLEIGGYGVLSGTSMSSPHVAGAVAAYLQAHPGTAPGDVRTILQNSADPKPWSGNPALGFLEHVHRQGAGMLDIPGAIGATTRVTPGKIALGESVPAATQLRTLTIRNDGPASVTYTISHDPALATGGSTFTPGAFPSFATVTFSPATVAVPAGGTATVNASITAPAVTGNRQYGGYLVVSGGDTTYRVPYAGFRGDYQSIQALVATSNGFPWLAKRVATSANSPLSDWQKQAAGAVYTLKHGTDVPWVLFHLDHQVSRLRLDVYEADGTLWGSALDITNFGRNSTATGFFSFQWDGRAASPTGPNVKVVKNASYYFKLTVLKALGDQTNTAHSESWTSPTFAVNREIEEP